MYQVYEAVRRDLIWNPFSFSPTAKLTQPSDLSLPDLERFDSRKPRLRSRTGAGRGGVSAALQTYQKKIVKAWRRWCRYYVGLCCGGKR